MTLDRVMRLRGLSAVYLQQIIFRRGIGRRHGDPAYRHGYRESAARWRIRRSPARRRSGFAPAAVTANCCGGWLSDEQIRARGRELITVDCAHFTADEYVKLQQALMQEIGKRRVLVETLPTSNVRISQYERFEEHHVLRWMRLPGALKEGDPEIMVSLGSDDPGIFAGELAGEFYQLYAVLRERGLTDKEALRRVAEINERGREYRFHDFAVG